jgi:hypothetical protein
VDISYRQRTLAADQAKPMSFIEAPTSLRRPARADRLRFVVICRAVGLRRWQLECLRAMTTSGEVVLVAEESVPDMPPAASRGWWQRLYDRAVTLGLRPYHVAGPYELPGVRRLKMNELPLAGPIDVVLDFGRSGAMPDAVEPLHGIWRIHLGDATEGELPATRETAWAAEAITVSVVSTTRGDATPCVRHYATIKTRRSHRATLHAVLHAAISVCQGACNRLREPAAARVAPRAIEPLPAAGPLRTISAQIVRLVRRAIDVIFLEDIWTIGIIDAPVELLLRSTEMPLPDWHEFASDGVFHADPFPVKYGETSYVLFEKFLPVERRGLIACGRLDGADAGATAKTAIDLGCHMSYPAVFAHEGSIFCAPETHVLGGLRIFRMERDPWHWTQVAHMLPEMPLLDATLVEHEGSWWLTATLAGPYSDTDLHLWHAPSPFGPWTPHQLNPVKSDVRSSRPAGNLFRLGDCLYRPAQDCAGDYGTAVMINKVVRLDPKDFVEIPVKRFSPDPDWRAPDGLHTFNVLNEQVVIDAKRRAIRGRAAFQILVSRSRGFIDPSGVGPSPPQLHGFK